MFITGLLRWWYVDGWRERVKKTLDKLANQLDFFSIGLLFRTLFSLYRQDGAGRVEGSLGDHVRAFFDRQISRIIGAMVRMAVIIFGSIVITITAIVQFFILIIWFFVPLFPVFGLILAISGWVPWP